MEAALDHTVVKLNLKVDMFNSAAWPVTRKDKSKVSSQNKIYF